MIRACFGLVPDFPQSIPQTTHIFLNKAHRTKHLEKHPSLKLEQRQNVRLVTRGHTSSSAGSGGLTDLSAGHLPQAEQVQLDPELDHLSWLTPPTRALYTQSHSTLRSTSVHKPQFMVTTQFVVVFAQELEQSLAREKPKEDREDSPT